METIMQRALYPVGGRPAAAFGSRSMSIRSERGSRTRIASVPSNYYIRLSRLYRHAGLLFWLAASVPIGGEDASHLARCAIRSRRAAIHGVSVYLARAAQ